MRRVRAWADGSMRRHVCDAAGVSRACMCAADRTVARQRSCCSFMRHLAAIDTIARRSMAAGCVSSKGQSGITKETFCEQGRGLYVLTEQAKAS